MVERGGVKEFGWLLRPIHVNAILHKMVNIEELEFIDELPVSAQVPIGGGAESWSLGVGEVGLHMDERGDTVLVLMAPDLAHERSVEIRLTTEEQVDGWVAQELRENDDFSGSVEDCV